MKHILFLFLAILFCALPSLSSNLIHLKITDETKVGLPYCDVYVKNKWHLLTDNDGRVKIPITDCHIGDTIQISFMGYEKFPIIVSSQFLQNEQQTYQLTPETYTLDEVVTLGNSEKFFEKKKRNLLLPYSEKHIVHVAANVSYVDKDGKQISASGKLKILFKINGQEILENTCTTDSLLLSHIRRSLFTATCIPYECCFKRIRKLNDIYYLGIQDTKWTFRFDVKPQFVTHPYYNLQKGDETSSIVNVDKDGFISKIEIRIDAKSGKSKSYNLITDYREYKRKMAPAHISRSLINEKIYIDLICTYEE